MNRRSFLKGVAATFISVAVPLPQFVIERVTETIHSGLTLLELAKRNKSYLYPMAAALSEMNDIIRDAEWVEV